MNNANSTHILLINPTNKNVLKIRSICFHCLRLATGSILKDYIIIIIKYIKMNCNDSKSNNY